MASIGGDCLVSRTGSFQVANIYLAQNRAIFESQRVATCQNTATTETYQTTVVELVETRVKMLYILPSIILDD